MKKIILLLSLFATATAMADANFLTLSDVHYLKGGPVVGYGQGDTGDVLWQSTKQQLKQRISQDKPEYMVLLGDLPAHDNETRTTNIQAVLTDLSTTLKIPVFYVPGNNDALGNDLKDGDYHSFTNNQGANLFSLDPGKGWPALNADQSCDSLANTHSACLINPKDPTLEKFGYYAARPLGQANPLRLIVLNSVIFTSRYVSDDGVSQKKATAEELTWFKGQLAEALTAGDRVLIALHVPPGLDAYSDVPMWDASLPAEASFMADITAYQTIITGVLYGHTHMDEFRRLNNLDGSLSVLALSTPGITPGHYNSPGFERFSYDEHLALTDGRTYYTDPLNSDAWYSYGFKAIYGCTDTTLFACAAQFSLQDDAFVTTYKGHYAVANPDFQPNYWSNILAAIDVSAASVPHHSTYEVFLHWPRMFQGK